MTQTVARSIVALKPLPYEKIRHPGEVFTATKGYADLFVKRGMAREATEVEAANAALDGTVTREMAASKPSKKPARRNGYQRRDKRAQE